MLLLLNYDCTIGFRWSGTIQDIKFVLYVVVLPKSEAAKNRIFNNMLINYIDKKINLKDVKENNVTEN